MANQVWLSSGVTIAGRHHPHGAIVDVENLVEKPVAKAVPEGAQGASVKEENDTARKKYEEEVAKAKAEYEEHVKTGVIAPVVVESAKTSPKASFKQAQPEKEG